MNPDLPFIARPQRADLPWLAGLAALTAGMTLAVTHRMVAAGTASDYSLHIETAATMARTHTIAVPQYLYHLTTILIHALLFGRSFGAAAQLATVGYAVLLSVLVYLVLRPACGPAGSARSAALAAVVAQILVVVSPVTVLTWPQQDLYFGYIGVTVYHNPTVNTLKPLALLLSLVAVRVYPGIGPRRSITLAAAAALAVLATIAKPNYTMCLLPALALVAAYRLWRRQPFDWLLALAMVGPAVGVLAWQYQLTYGTSEPIQFAPLLVILRFTSPASLLPKLVLSILFPLAVYGLYWRAARHDTYFNLSWLIFIVSLGFMYLLAEGGERQFHGNFWWGSQVALFLLFVAAARCWLAQRRSPEQARPGDARTWVIAVVLGLHLLSGLVWYFTQLVYGQAGWS